MASIVLSTAAGAAASSAGASLGSALISQAVSYAGNTLIGSVFSKPQKRHTEGARLESLAVQTSTYGKGIPQVFGTMRMAGNVIWSLPIKEVASTTSVRTGGKGGRSSSRTVTQTEYSYSITLAIAIGEGPITRLERVWADAKLLDLGQGTYRMYHGTEDQLPDSFIETIEGVGRTPAYRGLAYVVIEDFPLASFGNRIPNFTFEVTRNVSAQMAGETPLESRLESVVLLPGSGEYVYDTQIAKKTDGVNVNGNFIQQGYQAELNAHTPTGKADALVALDQLQDALPNVQWVALTANWFGTSLNAGACEIFPCVDFKTSSKVTPNAWAVAGYTRASARLIGQDNNRARYGGTPDDESILRLVAEMKMRGLNVFFYPLMLMDLPGKPWRGEITGDAGDVAGFFNRENGYRRFILHYANLLKGKVDAFAIGSELKALTAISDAPGSYLAVDALVQLAADVKAIMGPSTLITYAADWSEYHHTGGGWYHLDPLWASPDIDVVGIDAYFPLTDKDEASISEQDIVDGWTSGEGYDWVYTDETRTATMPVQPEYAWKNIRWWWENAHVNPNAANTPWVPQSKPIWFTEIGYASVDGTTNEPNVFVDPTTAASSFPRFSRQRVDFNAQRRALEAAENVWGGSDMVTRRFFWAWDLRPYPAWPDLLNMWADGGNWVTGHWLQGKLGASQLRAIVAQLLMRAGLKEAQFDVQALKGQVDGLIVPERTTIRAVLEQLQTAFAFDLLESNGKIMARHRKQQAVLSIDESALVPFESESSFHAIQYTRKEELELPKRLELRYLDRFENYGTSVQSAIRQSKQARDTETVSLSLTLADSTAKALTERLLYERWQQRESWQFQLPIAYADLEAGDVITLHTARYSLPLVLTQVQMGRPGLLRVRAQLYTPDIYEQYIAPVMRNEQAPTRLAPTLFEALDLPLLPGEQAQNHGLKFAFSGTQAGWPGALLLEENLADAARDIVLSHQQQAVMGSTLTALADSNNMNVMDETASVEVALLAEGALQSVSMQALLNGANAALIGDELVQFANVQVLGNQHVRLSRMLRGRLGSEWASSGHVAGERFVLLDRSLARLALDSGAIGKMFKFLAVTSGLTEEEATIAELTYHARALKPYAPVHLRAEKQANGDIVFSWQRRTRLNGEWRDFVDVPLNEDKELYLLEIRSNDNFLRKEILTNPDFTYSLSMQLADSGAQLTQGAIQVSQISTLVGAGYESQKTFVF